MKQRIAAILFIFFLATGFAAIGAWGYIQAQVGDRIYPHTAIDGIDMGYKTKEEALSLLQERDEYFHDAFLEVMYKDTPIASFSGEQLKLKRDIETRVDQAYLIGRSDHIPSRIAQQLNGVIHLQDFVFKTQIEYDKDQVEQFITQTAEAYNRPAKDALFQFEDGKVTDFKAHENGLQIKQEDFLVEMHSKIQSVSSDNKRFQVKIQEGIVEPEITLGEANDQGIEELIGVGTSDYSHSIPSRIHNVILAASKFNGVLIPKGETFSFNEIIGDISARTGYQQAWIISGGRTVLGDGGGVCQVSTTAFRAALNTGLPIVERHAHAYRVSYYENDSEPGFDATIFSPTVDLKFENNTPGAILIQTEVDKENMILTFKVYGKRDGRTVSISEATVWDIAPPPEPLYEDDPTMPAGQVKQVDYAAWGAKASFDYKVTAADGKTMHEETFYSSFRPWKAVFLRGTGEQV